LLAYPSMVWAFSDYGNYLPVIALLLAGLVLLLARRQPGGAPISRSPGLGLVLIFLGVSLFLGVPTMAVRRDSRYVMAHMAIISVLVVSFGRQGFTLLKTSPGKVHGITAGFIGALMAFYILRTTASFADLKETMLPPLSAEARAQYRRTRLQDYDANVALSHAGLAPHEKVYGAYYPARVHYVMTGAAMHPDYLLSPGSMLKEEDLAKLRRQHIHYIFGTVPVEVEPLLRKTGEYGGKPLYKVL
jgi:hypothetical protein